MKVFRKDENNFQVVLDNDEVEAFERYACESDMGCQFFIKWLLMTGLKIFSLTLDGKDFANELEGKN